jgi:Fe2+ or Zn2+ uptake regulation protein
MPRNKDGKTFTCDQCGRVFEFIPEAEEKAQQECLENYGCSAHSPGMAIICDTCYLAAIRHPLVRGMN